MSIPSCSLDRELFNVSLSICLPLITSFSGSEAASANRLVACKAISTDEHSAIKTGENKVSPHLHPPVHKEEPTIIAFRGHLLLVMGKAALWSTEKVELVMVCTLAI